MKKNIYFLACVLLLSSGCGSPFQVEKSLSSQFYRMDEREFKTDGTSRSHIVIAYGSIPPQKFAQKYPLLLSQNIPSLKTAVYELTAPGDPGELIARICQAEPLIGYADTVNRVSCEKTVNDPGVKNQYALALTHVFQAWDITMGDPSTVIAVLDTGIDPNHPDLVGKVFSKYNAFTKDDQVKDGSGHGTHTAGIVAATADNGGGIAGMAPGCGLMIIQALDVKGNAPDSIIAEGIVWAADHGAKVMSMSFGLYKKSKILGAALQYALDKDICLVASAGNDDKWNDTLKAPHLPSSYPGVIEVSATDSWNRRAEFSNHGKTVAVAAPGVNILSTTPTYDVSDAAQLKYGYMSGTSMAAPCVAGIVGLIRSQHPDWNRTAVVEQLKKSTVDLGTPGYDEYFGFGRVDAFKALSL